MFRVSLFHARATHRRTRTAAAPTPPVVVVRRDTMARRQRPSDSTQVMLAVTDATCVLPVVPSSDSNRTVDRQAASSPLPPSQQPHPVPSEPWRPQVGGDGPWAGFPVATEVRHDRRSRQIFTDLPSEAPVYAEDSYQSLASYDGPGRVVRVAAVDASWFRTGVCDETRFDALMERFVIKRGVFPDAAADHPAGSLDTQEYTVAGFRQFSNDTYGKAAA